MPDASEVFNLGEKSPVELEARRREITAHLNSLPKGYDDPACSTETLQELAAITSILRRKHAGPPKVAKRTGPKASLEDLM